VRDAGNRKKKNTRPDRSEQRRRSVMGRWDVIRGLGEIKATGRKINHTEGDSSHAA